jgi:hypothetical protein
MIRRTLAATLVAIVASSGVARAQIDQIPIADMRVVGGSPDVRGWPVTAAITSIEFTPSNFYVHFTRESGATRWPDVVPPGWDGSIEFTLWTVVNVGGTWYTTGCVEFWSGREWDGVGGPYANAAKDWYFQAAQIGGHQPTTGELVGFFVTAGDQRVKDVHLIAERSNIVAVNVPPNQSGKFDFSTDTAPPIITPAPPPPPPPTPPPAPPSSPGPVVMACDLAPIVVQLGSLNAQINACNQGIANVGQNVTDGRKENQQFEAQVKGVWDSFGKPFMQYIVVPLGTALATWAAAHK